MKFTLALALFSSAAALAPAPQRRAAGVAVDDSRRTFLTQSAGVLGAALLAPGSANADGAVSAATVARSRGIYGLRVAGLAGAVEAGDFKAVYAEKNAFELFNSGAYTQKSAAAKAAKAVGKASYADIMAACKAGDKAGLKSAYATFMKNANIDANPIKNINDGQGYSSDYDWKRATAALALMTLFLFNFC